MDLCGATGATLCYFNKTNSKLKIMKWKIIAIQTTVHVLLELFDRLTWVY